MFHEVIVVASLVRMSKIESILILQPSVLLTSIFFDKAVPANAKPLVVIRE